MFVDCEECGNPEGIVEVDILDERGFEACLDLCLDCADKYEVIDDDGTYARKIEA